MYGYPYISVISVQNGESMISYRDTDKLVQNGYVRICTDIQKGYPFGYPNRISVRISKKDIRSDIQKGYPYVSVRLS